MSHAVLDHAAHRRAPRFAAAVGATLALLLAAPSGAGATALNSGEAGGAWHKVLCPRLEGALKRSSFAYACAPSEGTADNLRRVVADPRHIGFGQLDILALEGGLGGPGAGAPPSITIIRRDDARECLFAVTRNKDVATWGDLAANAAKLRFVLPPATSGSAGSFRYLQAIDRDGLGRAGQVAYAESAVEAVRRALSADDTATLFVALPDADGAPFKLAAELGGHFVPVIDRAILRQQVGGEKIYFAEEVSVPTSSWWPSGTKAVTACTPLAIFTGPTERIAGDKAQQDHRDLVATVRAIKAEELVPAEGLVQRLWRRTRELSAAGIDEVVELSEKARAKAGPLVEGAKEATGKAIDAAKPMLDKARELGREAIEKAEREAKELIQKAEREAKELVEKAEREAKDLLDKTRPPSPKKEGG